jgi:hypothetical protein
MDPRSTAEKGTTMSDSNTPILDSVEAIRRRYYGEPEPEGADDAKERARLAREAAERHLTNRDNSAERRRYAAVRRTLLGAVGGLRHQQRYSPTERRAVVDDALKGLGTNDAGVRSEVARLIDVAADAIVDGDKATGLRAVDDVAVALVNTNEQIGVPAPAAGEDLDALSPRDLAARIARL